VSAANSAHTAAQSAYRQGRAAFERGSYREAVTALEQAKALVPGATLLGGEVQLWLMNAYSAANRPAEALALGEALARHPNPEIRKQSQHLLYILKAPQLKRPENWMIQIPDLQNIDEKGDAGGYRPPSPPRPRPPVKKPEPLPLSQVNTEDNGFLWVVLGGVMLVLGGMVWLG